MDEFLKLLLPIFLTALGAYGLYQIEKDHKRRALAQQLRTEIGIITFAVKIFFKDWETKGNGDRVIKEYKGNNFFQINAKIYSANLTNLNLLGQELFIELVLLYSNLERFQQTPLPQIIKKYEDGFSHADAILDGAKQSLKIIIPRLCFFTLPWWRRIGL
ncbi:MAG: hypothetical protein IIB64_08575, partial [Proteobacteria bacterium]|nr:hypothetical protein [Pseudomonadota bacterium]